MPLPSQLAVWPTLEMFQKLRQLAKFLMGALLQGSPASTAVVSSCSLVARTFAPRRFPCGAGRLPPSLPSANGCAAAAAAENPPRLAYGPAPRHAALPALSARTPTAVLIPAVMVPSSCTQCGERQAAHPASAFMVPNLRLPGASALKLRSLGARSDAVADTGRSRWLDHLARGSVGPERREIVARGSRRLSGVLWRSHGHRSAPGRRRASRAPAQDRAG
jgi:hypothetical protein